MTAGTRWSEDGDVPRWVPKVVLNYLAHTEGGIPLRGIARTTGLNASTVMRQVRKLEARRDDTLVDLALDRFRSPGSPCGAASRSSKDTAMNAAIPIAPDLPSDETIEREARRVLRRLNEPRACLAVARDMEKAVVVRDTADGQSVRTAVVDRPVAEAMALKDWISCDTPGRISRYRITPAGRAALRRLLADAEGQQAAYAGQHRDMKNGHVSDDDGNRRRVRYNAAESPVLALARRRDKSGNPFLTDRMVAAGERLREDFELAQMGPRVTQNWDRFLTAGDRSAFRPETGMAEGPRAARDRVMSALEALGPGLGDVALRCCCFLEGLEATERRMGWSARSGKIVLRIALQALCRHYDDQEFGWSPLIG